MRKTVIEAAALVGLLLGGALASCQEPVAPAATDKKDQLAKSKLEELLEKALHDNPDVRLAEAKLAEAQAELSRARLQAVQKVVAAFQAIEAQKTAVESATAELKETQKNFQTGSVPITSLHAADQKLIDAKAKLADLESELNYALGQQPAGVDAKILASWMGGMQLKPVPTDPEFLRRLYLDFYGRLPTKDEIAAGVLPIPSMPGPTADRIRAALDKPFEFECKDKSVPVRTVLKEMNLTFQGATVGLVIKDNLPEGDKAVISVDFYGMPLGAALELIEDATGNRVAVRDYGLVVAPKDELPPGAPLLDDFWKGAKAVNKVAGKESPPSPSDRIEGLVKAIDKDLVSVSIGSDAGLVKGQILEVYRLPTTKDATAKYLGKIRVEDVKPTEAIARLESDFQSLPKPGDHVASKLADK